MQRMITKEATRRGEEEKIEDKIYGKRCKKGRELENMQRMIKKEATRGAEKEEKIKIKYKS